MAVIKCKNNIFVLDMKNTHYVVAADKNGLNRHIYWGKKCDVGDYEIQYFGDENSNHTMLDEMKQECTVFGGTLYRDCVIKATFFDGCREIDAKFDGCTVGKNELKLNFKDDFYDLKFSVNYRLYKDTDIFSKSITVENTGDKDIVFEKLCSAELTLPDEKPYKIMNTNGAWGGEFIETQAELDGGALVFESRKGASNHNNSPYFIAHINADEEKGDVYFASLAYSGNFKVTVSRDLYSRTRAILGMNDFDFSFTLKGGEVFETPEVYCGFTANGFGDMTRQMNAFCIENILPEQFAKKELDVLYNSWESTEFNVSTKQQTALAKRAAAIGVELFVMDDGWFKGRKNDRAGLGDWVTDEEKFPNGLDELIETVNSLSMKFGLWIEPEMVNPDSDLYRNHPDWTYHYEHRNASELRHQLVLNLTRKDVQNYIFETLDNLLSNHNIEYIKWDMNRPFSQTGASNLENPQMYSYLHTKAVYDIVDALKDKHKNVAFESCASGGGRCDLGALKHFDQCWTSDNTDGIDRMTIQKGYSKLRPVKTMRAWVTDINWINKPCSLDFRFNIAMQGALGLGGNLLNYSDDELEICRKNIALYKEIRTLVQFGDLYRMRDFDENEYLLNEYVSHDKSKAVCFLAAWGTRFFKKRVNIKLAGLDENAVYMCNFGEKQITKSGAYLKNCGIPIHIRGASFNKIIIIKRV